MPTPYFQDESVTIYHADIREFWRNDVAGLEWFGPPLAAVVTSPPYNVGLDYGNRVKDAGDWDRSISMPPNHGKIER